MAEPPAERAVDPVTDQRDPDAESEHGESLLTVLLALGANFAIAVAKAVAGVLTGSSALLSEAAHSVADCGTELFLLTALRRSAKPADARHPFGYGLQLYFYTFVVAVLIFGVGAVVSIAHGLEKIRHPAPVQHAWLNYVVLGLGVLFEGGVWIVALRAFNAERAGRSPRAACRRRACWSSCRRRRSGRCPSRWKSRCAK